MKKIKTIRGYQALARFHRELNAAFWWLPRRLAPAATPYQYGPTVAVRPWGGKFVWIAETKHKTWEIWTIPAALIHESEAEAERIHFAKP